MLSAVPVPNLAVATVPVNLLAVKAEIRASTTVPVSLAASNVCISWLWITPSTMSAELSICADVAGFLPLYHIT